MAFISSLNRPQGHHLKRRQMLLTLLIITTLASLNVTVSQETDQPNPFGSQYDNNNQLKNDNPKITVVAPRFLRPNNDYHVLVRLETGSSAGQVDLQLTGGRDSDQELTEAKSILVEAGETQTVKFAVGEWPAAEYLLNVSAQATDRSWKFSQEAPLTYLNKNQIVLVQTDKPIYRGADLVNFRAIFLMPNLQPVTSATKIKMTIVDPRKRIVKSWPELESYRGLLTLDFRLSEEPQLGHWTIQIESAGQTTEKQFQVANYQLPAFGVEIQLPAYATFDGPDELVVGVKSSHTFGKPVRGHATLTIQPLARFHELDTRPLKQVQHRARLDPERGLAEFPVNLVRESLDGMRDPLLAREVEFFALVEEDLTGRKYNATRVLLVHPHEFRLERVGPQESAKPGLDLPIRLRLVHHDGRPVANGGPQAEVRISSQGGHLIETARIRPTMGEMQYNLRVPRQVDHSEEPDKPLLVPPTRLEVEITYKGHRYQLEPPIRVQQSESGHYLRVSVDKWAGSSIGEQPEVLVESTEPIRELTCQGVARGDIVWASSPRPGVNSDQRKVRFKIQLDHRSLLQLRIMCFYIRQDSSRELIADSTSFPVFGSVHQNGVKIRTSKTEAKPGDDLQVDVHSHPNSLVGVMAIDHSLELIQTRNKYDVSQEDVNNQLESLSSGPALKQPGSGANTERVFEEAQLIVLTSNHVHSATGRSFGRLLYGNGNQFGFVSDRPESGGIRLGNLIGVVENIPDRTKSSLPSARALREPLVLRSDFPETWLWQNGTSGSDGVARFKGRLPDSISSWSISAFSINEAAGFGVSREKASVRVIRSFFLTVQMPHAVVRGETFVVQALLFNYGTRSTRAKVSLEPKRAGDFELIDPPVEGDSTGSEGREVRVRSNDSVPVNFLIRPLRLGSLELKVLARGELAADAILKRVQVKPEGQPQRLSRSLLIELDNTKDWSQNISLDWPPNRVPGSERLVVALVGDPMGAALANVDQLAQSSGSTADQALLQLASNQLALGYLSATGRLRETHRSKATENVELARQKLLNFRSTETGLFSRYDGNSTGDLWLTASALKALARSSDPIEPEVIDRAREHLLQSAQQDGSLGDPSEINKQGMSPIRMTSHIVEALLASPIPKSVPRSTGTTTDSNDDSQINTTKRVLIGAINYLENQISTGGSGSTSDLAAISLGLALTNRPEAARNAFDKLWSEAKQDESSTIAWWPLDSSGGAKTEPEVDEFELTATRQNQKQPPLKPVTQNKRHSEHLFVPEPEVVETAALALRTALRLGEIERATPIARWLFSQQDAEGYFGSAQSTLIALEALTEYSQVVRKFNKAASNSLVLDLIYPRSSNGSQLRGRTHSDQLLISGHSNELIQQRLELAEPAGLVPWILARASGGGRALLQLAWHYNLLVSAESPAFYLNAVPDQASNADYLQLAVCTYFRSQQTNRGGQESAGESSGEALLEVGLPSGFQADADSIDALRHTQAVKKVHLRNQDSLVEIYLEQVGRDEICVTVPAYRVAKVANPQPAVVQIRDLQRPQRAARLFYRARRRPEVCELCESETCRKVCSKWSAKPEIVSLPPLHDQRRHLMPKQLTKVDETEGPNNRSARLQEQEWRLPTNVTALLPLAPLTNAIREAYRNHLANL